MFISHVVFALVVSEELGQSCRKRAFQLLQALNNISSLPNAVPGPMSSRSDGGSNKEMNRPPTVEKRQQTSQWTTSNREGLPLFSQRPTQGLYAPAIQGTQRDLSWRIFPLEMPKLEKKNGFARAGAMSLR